MAKGADLIRPAAALVTLPYPGRHHPVPVGGFDRNQQLNLLLRGWIAYCGRYTPSALSALFRYVNLTLLAWVLGTRPVKATG